MRVKSTTRIFGVTTYGYEETTIWREVGRALTCLSFLLCVIVSLPFLIMFVLFMSSIVQD